MKKKLMIGLGALALVACIGVGIFLLQRSPKQKSEIQAVGYLTFYDNYDPDFQSHLRSAVESNGNDFFVYDCNRSSSMAESGATSAINSKVKTVFIDYPEQAVAQKVADKLQQAGVAAIILGAKHENYTTLSTNISKVQQDMSSQVKKSVPSADMVVGLSAQEKPSWSKDLTTSTARQLATDLNIDPSYQVLSSLIDQQINARDYLVDLLTVSHDRANVIIVCDSATVALGLQQAAQELNKQGAVTIVCYGGSRQLSGDVSTFVLEKDYTNLQTLIQKPSNQEMKYLVKKL